MEPDLVLIPGGSFLMGCDSGRQDERPAHRVTLAAFRAARLPVTNAEYAVYLKDTGAEAPPFWDDPRFIDPRQPVVGVSWFEAVAYGDWLSRRTGLHLRLPTEAEREYAARGGIDEAEWPWGPASPASREDLADIALRERPHPPEAR